MSEPNGRNIVLCLNVQSKGKEAKHSRNATQLNRAYWAANNVERK